MIIHDTTVYRCDHCQKLVTGDKLPSAWFAVSKFSLRYLREAVLGGQHYCSEWCLDQAIQALIKAVSRGRVPQGLD